MTRGFSLIEMMLVVAILAILAALAVPAMSPQVDLTKLEGGAEAVGSFMARAQAEAMASKRCVRVRFEPTSGPATSIVAEKLNAYDCDVDPTTAPKIIASLDTWIKVAELRIDHKSLEYSFDPVPSETNSSALGNGEPDQIRFRPSGRLFSADLDITDDDGVIMLRHPEMTAANTKKVLVESQGLVCVIDRGISPGGSGNNLSCP